MYKELLGARFRPLRKLTMGLQKNKETHGQQTCNHKLTMGLPPPPPPPKKKKMFYYKYCG